MIMTARPRDVAIVTDLSLNVCVCVCVCDDAMVYDMVLVQHEHLF